jgi:AcrR family transcriptional regulator
VGDEQPTRLRADARRNRDRIVAAAKTCFAAQGPEAPTEEIARVAGVAAGTLYRHFADREALIRAVAVSNFDNAVSEAQAAVAEEASAWDALVRILRQSQELRLSFRLLMAYPHLHAILRKERRADQSRQDMINLLDRAVRRAQAEGSLRADIGTGDIAVMFALLASPLSMEWDETAQLASERCMALVLESLRAGAHAPLPGRPIRPEDLTPACDQANRAGSTGRDRSPGPISG